eukprot:gene18712-25235_t
MVKSKPKANGGAEGKELAKDVAAFASQLGLASGGGGSEFDDFAPEMANKSIASEKKAKRTAKAAASGKTLPDGEKTSRAAKPDERQSAGDKPAAKAPGREWNVGVGPRPGGATGKSLLGRDDASIWYEAASALPPLELVDDDGEEDPDLVERMRQQGELMLEAETASFEKDMSKRNAADAKWLDQVKRSGTTQDKVAAITLTIQGSAHASLKGLDTLLLWVQRRKGGKEVWVQRRKGGKEVVRQAIEALQELFLAVMLPDRKLKYLEQQPLKSLPEGKAGQRQLLFWACEDAIKRRYNMFVTALEECSKDNLDFLKEKATKTIYELMCKKPEAEARLLSALVNKLGDPSRKIASKAGYLLSQLLLQHPAMKPVVVREGTPDENYGKRERRSKKINPESNNTPCRSGPDGTAVSHNWADEPTDTHAEAEIDRILFRPGLQDRARYYCIVFLNQMALSHKDSEGGADLAKKLIDLYFVVFKLIIEGHMGNAAETKKIHEEKWEEEKKKFWKMQRHKAKKDASRGNKDNRASKGPKPPKKPIAEEMDARMLSALITGVRRAFPYVNSEEVEPMIDRHGEHLFRMVHKAPFSVSVQALMLMYQLMSARNSISDRFYRALYSVLITEGTTTSSKAPMFLALLFKAMKFDVSSKRVSALAKRLLQDVKLCSTTTVLSKVMILHRDVKLCSTTTVLSKVMILHRVTSTQTGWGMCDPGRSSFGDLHNNHYEEFHSSTRPQQLTDGLMHIVSCVAASSFACGALFLISEVLKAQPALWAGILNAEDVGDDGEEENFKDLPGER